MNLPRQRCVWNPSQDVAKLRGRYLAHGASLPSGVAFRNSHSVTNQDVPV